MAYDGSHTQLLRRNGVRAWNDWRLRNPGSWPDLVQADLRGMDLRGINLFTADLRSANLSECNLEDANLGGSILIRTDLTRANLRNANLYIANLNGAVLTEADLSSVTMGVTILVDMDLRTVKGLGSVHHLGRSHVGVDTLYRSKGEISPAFLAATGLSDEFLKNLGIFNAPTSVYHSCFISYSTVDSDFVKRLHNDLQKKGVRCWYAPEDMKIGNPIRRTLDDAIGRHDRLLLVLSATSVASQWVEQEVERALELERREGRLVLFPVRLDDTVFEVPGWAALIKNTRHVGDFRDWRDASSYDRAFSRLLRDLQ